MATKSKPTSKRVKSKSKPNGNGAHASGNGAKSNGNGAHRNGNGAKSNGNGAHRNGNGAKSNGKGNGAVATAEARRVATEMGSALLLANSVETAQHSDDVELIAGAIVERLGLPNGDREDILAGARLHDIGKASISPRLLEKPTSLTADEWEQMRTHTIVGQQILGSVPELDGIARLVRHSHERWDGTGYPDGLAANEIPLGSRIIFCADAFHAIRSDRAYRRGVSAAQALGEIRRCSGTQFDPEVVAAFEQTVRDLRLVPRAGRRSKGSTRLAALLLCLAVGGGGSAVAGSGLLGEPDPATVPAPSAVLDCGSLYCDFLFPEGIGATGPPSAGPLGKVIGPLSPLSTLPGTTGIGGNRAIGGPGSVESRPQVAVGGPTPGDVTGGEDSAHVATENPPQQEVKPPKPPKASTDKNPNANGNGWATGHDKNGVPNGSSGSGIPDLPKPPDLPGIVGGPGNSANAPGHNKLPKI